MEAKTPGVPRMVQATRQRRRQRVAPAGETHQLRRAVRYRWLLQTALYRLMDIHRQLLLHVMGLHYCL